MNIPSVRNKEFVLVMKLRKFMEGGLCDPTWSLQVVLLVQWAVLVEFSVLPLPGEGVGLWCAPIWMTRRTLSTSLVRSLTWTSWSSDEPPCDGLRVMVLRVKAP